MKKKLTMIVVLLLALTLCTGLVGCGDSAEPVPAVSASDVKAPAEPAAETPAAEPAAEAPETPEKPEEPEEKLTFGFGLEENFEETEELDENPDRAITRATTPILQNVVTKLDGTCTRSEVYLYRSVLSETQKQAYDLIRAGLAEGKTEIQMTVPITKDEVKQIFRAVFYDGPDLFWVDGSYSFAYNNYGNITKVKPKYNDLAKDIPGNRTKFEQAVSEALADMWSLSDPTAQVKYAHDYLTSTIDYDINAVYNQTAYSALVNKKSVCAGYSRAFQYMMQKMDVPCGYITGTATSAGYSGSHAWNIVELGGEYYAMDTTWDDPVGAKAGKFYYDYFNLTDKTISADHVRGDISTKLPAATGTAKSFAAAFGGNQYGTDFAAIQGKLPEGYGTASTAFIGAESSTAPDTSGNPYLP